MSQLTDLLVLLEDCHGGGDATSSGGFNPSAVEEYLRLERGGDNHLSQELIIINLESFIIIITN